MICEMIGDSMTAPLPDLACAAVILAGLMAPVAIAWALTRSPS